MAEPVTTKTSTLLLALFGASSAPLLGEWSMVLVGALGGASLHISVTNASEMPRWWSPFLRFAQSLIAGLIFTRFTAPYVTVWLGSDVPVEPDAVLMGVAGMVALWWRLVLVDGGRWIADRFFRKNGGAA